jgi:hypothetical protein
MNADPAEVYSFRDFDGHPGLMLEYSGATPPGSDPESIHVYKPPAEYAPRERSFVREGELEPEHEALAQAMKEQGVSYRALAERVGTVEKTFYYRIRHHVGGWEVEYRAAALALGRPDLLQFIEPKGERP